MLGNYKKKVWLDTSSRSRGEKNTSPDEYTYYTNTFRISMHRHIDYPKDQWFVTCHELGMQRTPLTEKDDLKAQKEAIKTIQNRLRAALKELSDGQKAV